MLSVLFFGITKMILWVTYRKKHQLSWWRAFNFVYKCCWHPTHWIVFFPVHFKISHKFSQDEHIYKYPGTLMSSSFYANFPMFMLWKCFHEAHDLIWNIWLYGGVQLCFNNFALWMFQKQACKSNFIIDLEKKKKKNNKV